MMSLGLALGCSDSGPAGDDPNDLLAQCDLFSDQVFDGGPGRGGIPSLTNPEITTVGGTSFYVDEDGVLGMVVNGQARAYPLIIMWWHELVNDTLGGQSVLISYCPLTGSGLAFDPRVDGTARSFGVSGLLFENNLMMFDHSSESLWPQLLLAAGCGPDRGAELTRMPVLETTWGEWKAQHPNTTVLTINTGHDRQYGQYPYGDYDDETNGFLFRPSSAFSTAREPKEPTLGVLEGTEAVAYPFGELDQRAAQDAAAVTAVNDVLGTRPIVVTFKRHPRIAVAFDRRVDNQTLTFSVSPTDSSVLIDDQTGSTWTVYGVAIEGDLAGTQLDQLSDAYVLFWFAWSIFHPETRMFEN